GNFWAPFNGVDGQKFPPVMGSYVAVKVYGPGHVIAYNYVANFHDGIDIETYGNPDGSAAVDGPKYPAHEYWDKRPVEIDFYNNTLISETAAASTSNVHLRNNLFLGENSAPAIFSVNTYTNYTSSDYNGFRLNPGAPSSFAWNSPPFATPADFSGIGQPAAA